MIRLGFDISTSCCGWAFTEDRKILDCGFIDISKAETSKDKTKLVTDVIDSNKHLPSVNCINVETALSGFGFGFTSQQVIIKLARFNAVFCYIIEEHYKKVPYLVNAVTARKQLFGKSRIKGIKPKVFVKDQIDKMFDMTPWLVYNKLKNVDKKMEDVYDAVVISFFKST